MTNFLQMANKFSSKKRREINKSKQKTSIEEKIKATINSLDSSNKKELLIFIMAIKKSDLKAKNSDITMIGADAYCTACHLKRAQLFAISMRDI